MPPTVWTPDKVVDIRKFAGISIDDPEEIRQRGSVFIIYGIPGSGKTSLAAQLVDSEFVKRGAAWLNADAQHNVIQHHIDSKKVQNFTITDFDQVEKFQQEYEHDQPWDLVVNDNITEYQELILTKEAKGGPREIQHYGTSSLKLLSLARKWRKIADKYGITVLMLAWEFADQVESDGILKKTITKHNVDLTDKLSQRFPGVVGTCIHLVKEDDRDHTRHILLDGASDRTQAKFNRNEGEKAVWSIPTDIYYRLGQKPLVDILRTVRNGATFPTEKYQRKAQKEE